MIKVTAVFFYHKLLSWKILILTLKSAGKCTGKGVITLAEYLNILCRLHGNILITSNDPTPFETEKLKVCAFRDESYLIGTDICRKTH